MENIAGRLAGLSPEKRELLEAILRKKRAESAAGTAIPPRDRAAGPPPLSFSQERLWLIDQLDPDSPAYNLPVATRLRGALDVEALRRSLEAIRGRHESLRTRFEVRNGAPVQAIDPPSSFSLPLVDLAGLPEGRREAELERLCRADAARPFDLRRGPVFRATLLRVSHRDHTLLATMHHIVSDGWSTGVFGHELGGFYEGFSAGRPDGLPPLPIQYGDFALWQRNTLEGPTLEAQLDYWRRRLAGLEPVLELPADRSRPARRTAYGGFRPWRPPGALLQDLRALSTRERTTLFAALLSGFFALLHRQTQRADLCAGTPVAGRRRVEVEGLIGFFVNTLVLRGDLSGDPTFRELLARVHDTLLDAQAHQDVPFERLVSELTAERSLSYTPIFQVFCALQNTGGTAPRLPGLEVEGITPPPESTKFDLSLLMREDGGGLNGGVEYSLDLFDTPTIDRFLAQLQTLLTAMAARPEARVSQVPLLSPSERHQLLAEWGAGPAGEEPSAGACLHELFAVQAARTPGAAALVHGTLQWTYAELAARAGGLAVRLREMGAGPETRVAVCLERSAELIAALLGVLAAGAAYVPVDPTYPADRQAFMLSDSGAAVLVTRGRLTDGPAVLDLDAEIVPSAAWPAGTEVTPNHLAYIIYTSGSTGRPKGVAIEHRSAVTLADWARSQFSDEELAGVLASTSICFDVSIFEIFVPLAWGGRLILAENALELPALPAAAEVKVATMVPSAAAELARNGSIPPSVRTVGLGGEPVPSALAARLYESGTVERVLNMYGPSEDTTYSTVALVPPRGERPPAIGRPVSGARVYLVDRHGALVPPGVPGELWMAGAGLSRGYLGRPALTAERFIPDPFGPPGSRAYRTGDLVRFRPDGELEFLGRIDHQVKIRGFRVELGEIEEVLAGHPQVRECAVLVREDAPGVRFLAAYVSGGTVPDGELREWLAAKLPEYMVPTVFVRLEELPHTPNGKIDRKALPAPDREAAESYVAPSGPVEELLAEIWSEVLGLARVGAHDDFFALGGHSLLATRVVSRVRANLGVELPLRRFFSSPTIAALAVDVERERRGAARPEAPPIARVSRDRELPLSFAQERLWFLEQLEGVTLDVIPAAARLTGELRVEALAAALREIARRHEALRTRFVSVDGRPAQVIDPDWRPSLPLVDLSGLPGAARDRELRRRMNEEQTLPFDLVNGPLARFVLARLAADDFALLFTFHHLVSDGWSMGLLIREMAALYAAAVEDQRSPLPELPVQYADFAVWQREWLHGEALARLFDTWTGRLANLPPLELPTDRPWAAGALRTGNLPLALPRALAAGLHDLARRQGASLFMVLLAAFEALLHRHTGQDDFAVGSPIANRNRAETEPLIGFFVNTLVLRADARGNPSFTELIARARETTLEAYDGQDLPFARLVEALRPDRKHGFPLIEVLFTFQNHGSGEIAVPGLRISELDGELETRFHLPLSLTLWEAAGRLGGGLSYNLARFDPTTAKRWSGHLENLLAAVAEDPDRPLSALPLLSTSEHRQLLEWSADGEAIRLGAELAPIGIWGLGERSGQRARRRADGSIEPWTAPAGAAEGLGEEVARQLDEQARRLARLSETQRKLAEQRFRGQGTAAGSSTGPAAGPAEPRPLLVRLQAGEPGRLPFFCVHAIGGAVLSYGELARALGPGQPFYGIQAAGLAGGPAADDLRAMAAGYAAAVEAAEPRGPYLLGGWSFGGVVAFEMARQMRERGREVALVALLDSWAPGLVEEPEVPGEAEVLRMFLIDQARIQGIPAGALAGLTPPDGEGEAVAWMLDRAREAGLLKAGVSPGQVRAMVGVYRANLRALAEYRPEDGRPEPYDGRLLLFRPEANPYPDNGWEAFARKGVEVHTLPADHYSLLARPAVAELARVLGGALGQDRAVEMAAKALDLPADHPWTPARARRVTAVEARPEPELASLLQALAAAAGSNLFGVLLAGLAALLQRYTRQSEIEIGTVPSAGAGPRIAGVDLSGEPSLRRLLERAPFPEREIGRTPARVQAVLTFGDFSPLPVDFDLALRLDEGLAGRLEYDAGLYDPATAHRLLGHFNGLLRAAAAEPGRPLGELPLAAGAELQQLLHEWGGAGSGPALWTVLRMFARQVERAPDAVAVVQDGRSLTYAQLDRRSTALARRLRRLGARPETVVGICCPRSLEMIVGVLGILKSGAAYVPMDPTLPAERLHFLIDDAGAAGVVTVRSLAHTFAVPSVYADDETGAGDGEPEGEPIPGPLPGNLAYVLYTSGSTGRPKGVLVEHAALAHFVVNVMRINSLQPEDRLLQFSNLSFDASCEEIFGALCSGAVLVLRNDAMMASPALFLETCDRWGITILDFTTAYWHVLAAEISLGGATLPKSIRRVIIGGERAHLERVRGWIEAVGEHPQLFNSYGPTEATVAATFGRLDGRGGVVSIGYPYGGVLIWLLDPWLNPVPAGVPGEMHIGGCGLARGYRGRPDLTAERFIPAPFGEPGSRLYKSGDLARFLPDGQLEFVGRIDHQIKIRGFRVEPDEIAVVLTGHPEVRDAVAVANESAPGEWRLIAYAVPGSLPGPGTEELREYLKARLPYYMVPSDIVTLASLPMTPTGKVDRKALPKPEARRERRIALPENATEALLVEIWKPLLGIDEMGIDDNLFDLGVHSLLTPQFIARVRGAFQIDLPLHALFDSPTVRELALAVRDVLLSQIEDLSDDEAARLA
jgi:amino acid adenylation domain-containing protein